MHGTGWIVCRHVREGDTLQWDSAKRIISKAATAGTDIITAESMNREILAANGHCP